MHAGGRDGSDGRGDTHAIHQRQRRLGAPFGKRDVSAGANAQLGERIHILGRQDVMMDVDAMRRIFLLFFHGASLAHAMVTPVYSDQQQRRD